MDCSKCGIEFSAGCLFVSSTVYNTYPARMSDGVLCPSCWFPALAEMYRRWRDFDKGDTGYLDRSFGKAYNAHQNILNLSPPSCKSCMSYPKCFTRLIR